MSDEEVIRAALKIVGSYFEVPRDMISLCKQLGIKIKPLSEWLESGYTKEDFFRLARNEDGAASYFEGYGCGIFYNDFMPHHRVRFTLAEEIMHVVLGHVYDDMFRANSVFDAERYAQYEHEAKLGAQILLMPPTLYYRFRSLYKLKKLARIFDVSVQAAFRCRLYYEQNEDSIKNLSSYCPICRAEVVPDYVLNPIDVLGDML